MIDEEKTFEIFGYTSDKLTHGSGKRVIVICDNCGKERKVMFKQYRDLCISCCQLGRIHSEETKIKISKNNGKSMLGKKHTEKSKKKMSIKQSGIHNGMYGKSGKNSPTWNSKITNKEREIGRFYSEYGIWRNNVFERDNYTCQICNKRNVILRAHHICGYAENKELRTILSNGITLCRKCHDKFHGKYGMGKNTKKQFLEFQGEIK